MKSIKKLLILTFSFLFVIFSFGQEQKNFWEVQYLELMKNGTYVTCKKDSTVFLHQKKKDGKKSVMLYYTMNNGDSIKYYKEVDDYKKDTFNIANFKPLKTSKFKGNFKIEKNQLKFYPWKFTDDSLSVLNDSLAEYSLYIPIPDRTVIKVRFYSLQYGVLTLPAKIYLKSKSDTLLNNVETGANLNLMLGFKWGHKKYSYLPNAEDGTSYEVAWSINFILGISKVDLSEANTTPHINKEFSIGVLSWGFAFGHQYRSIGVYLATGVDTPLNKYGKNWNFKNKPWLGLGFGLGL